MKPIFILHVELENPTNRPSFVLAHKENPNIYPPSNIWNDKNVLDQILLPCVIHELEKITYLDKIHPLARRRFIQSQTHQPNASGPRSNE